MSRRSSRLQLQLESINRNTVSYPVYNIAFQIEKTIYDKLYKTKIISAFDELIKAISNIYTSMDCSQGGKVNKIKILGRLRNIVINKRGHKYVKVNKELILLSKAIKLDTQNKHIKKSK